MNQHNLLDNRDIDSNYEALLSFFFLNASLVLGVGLRSNIPSFSR